MDILGFQKERGFSTGQVQRSLKNALLYFMSLASIRAGYGKRTGKRTLGTVRMIAIIVAYSHLYYNLQIKKLQAFQSPNVVFVDMIAKSTTVWTGATLRMGISMQGTAAIRKFNITNE
ncbi:hypothetical protein HMPREF2531_02343 [Bacteroides intestinalis]|uniref:Uncharacterized protein n=1 Tax=Bacteroides intestinalis TaxID=329854 RepID=A0A139LFL7_9BACE|nr:hypothetical protein HMPREF2531_02343 [Bacteroides intestinalis]